MKICLAQLRPVKGDIVANIEAHIAMTNSAIDHKTDLIVFPELSITGYEPGLAESLAIFPDDARLNIFQQLSDDHHIIIGIGAPIKNEGGVCIDMILFHPEKEPQVYSKKYLHADEEPFFVPGFNESVFVSGHPEIALAICYELTIPQHSAEACNNGAKYYIASVAKTAADVDRSGELLSDISKQYGVTTLLSNCVGMNDGVMCAGGSAVWNEQGELLTQLDDSKPGLLIFDTINMNTKELLS